jgi:hypothetical protein
MLHVSFTTASINLSCAMDSAALGVLLLHPALLQARDGCPGF